MIDVKRKVDEMSGSVVTWLLLIPNIFLFNVHYYCMSDLATSPSHTRTSMRKQLLLSYHFCMQTNEFASI